MSILGQILDTKRAEVQAAVARRSLESLQAERGSFLKPRGFAAAVRAKRGPSIIAEIKRASPSKGEIRPDLDPVTTAKAYARGGAAALSILTDEQYFKGHLDYLPAVRAAGVELPILRKDFMVDAYQLWESRAAGADAILLIVAALSVAELGALYREARALELDVLIEVHDAAEMQSAVELLNGADASHVLLGINNRNLKTFVTDLAVTESLVGLVPQALKEQVTLVSESGIFTAADIKRLADCGAEGYLIGESLVKSGDPGDNLAALINESAKLLG